MSKLVLYHGSDHIVGQPVFGKGKPDNDYGTGFYCTESIELAKEWAVCRPETESGYVHTFDFDTKDLFIFDYEKESVLCWLSELMKHREAADSKRY